MVSGGSVLKDRRIYSCLIHTLPKRRCMHPARNLLMEQRIERGKRPFYNREPFASKGLRNDALLVTI